MKRLLPITMLTLALTLSGCAWVGRQMPWHHDSGSETAAKAQKVKSKPAKAQEIVTADPTMVAKVLRFNAVGRFVVLNFPQGHLPKLDQHLFLYRNGLKTAEVKVVGPQQDTCIVADLVSGDAQVDDTVRDQ